MHELSQRILRLWREHVETRMLTLLTTVRVISLLIALFALWGFYEIAATVFGQQTQSIDIRLLLALQQWHTPFLDQVMGVLTNIGSVSVLLAASLLIATVLLCRKRQTETVMLAIATIGAFGLNALLKLLFAHARPAFWQQTIEVNISSFPSGHAMMSLVVFGIIGYLLAAQVPRWRATIATITVLLVGAVGFSRLYFGTHWLTDLVAGYVAGTVWLVACILSLKSWKRRYRSRPQTNKRPLPSISSRK
ncbi:phosphatase PAP2 family protein [Leptolyngbya sp. FACHB-321]|nr:phosphatase PAP2 family protein [Leptolyngbya sp. FACHB-321]